MAARDALRSRRAGAKSTRASLGSDVNGVRDEDASKRKLSPLPLLGYRHWLVLAIGIYALHTFLTIVDSTYPTVSDATDLSRFSETRTRKILDELVSEGPRPSGSYALEVHAVNLIKRELEAMKKVSILIHDCKLAIKYLNFAGSDESAPCRNSRTAT